MLVVVRLERLRLLALEYRTLGCELRAGLEVHATAGAIGALATAADEVHCTEDDVAGCEDADDDEESDDERVLATVRIGEARGSTDGIGHGLLGDGA